MWEIGGGGGGERERERETQRWTRLMHNSCTVPSTYIFVFKYLNTSFAATLRGREGKAESGLEKYSAAYSPRSFLGADGMKRRILQILPSCLFLLVIFSSSSTGRTEITRVLSRVLRVMEKGTTRRIGDTRLRKAMKKLAGLSSAFRRGALLIISTPIRNCSLFSE